MTKQSDTCAGNAPPWTAHFQREPGLASYLSAYFGWEGAETRLIAVPLLDLARARIAWNRASRLIYADRLRALRAAGVEQDKLERIATWDGAACFDDLERLVLGYADALSTGGRVHEDRFALLQAAFSDEAVLELTFSLTMWDAFATMSKALRLGPDDLMDPLVEVPSGQTS